MAGISSNQKREKEKFIDLKPDTPMMAILANGVKVQITVAVGRNRKHRNRVRLSSPHIIRVEKA